MKVKLIRTFVPTIDFETSINFYKEMGFNELWRNEELCEIGTKEYNFFLQKYYVKEWANNFMLQLFVEDLDDLYAVCEKLVTKYEGTKIRPIFEAPYGKTFHIIGPAGELWHMTEVSEKPEDPSELLYVVYNNDVDTSAVGTQTLTLTAVDTAGNEATIVFEVTIYEGIDTTIYIPDGYYDGIDSLEGEILKAALNDIITGHTEYPYTSTATDVWDILRDADEDPDNSDNVIMFYSGFSWPKDCQDTVTPPDYCEMEIDGEMKQVEWNREHIWSKSRGPFDEDSYIAHNDAHHLVAAERRMNSTKNNRHFEDCHDGDDENVVDRGYGNYTCNDWEFEPRDDVKGDVARMIFYMAVRYEGEGDDMVDLEIVDDPDSTKSSKLPIYGDIDDLLRWHEEDPVSQWEIERNETIYQYQGNRNPFIDLPELVELIWGRSEDYN